MLIAIDYDLTYTLDKAFWDEVMLRGRASGHEFVCITGRAERDAPTDIPARVICSPDAYKARTARRLGLNVHVWIDDSPGAIEPGRMLEWEP